MSAASMSNDFVRLFTQPKGVGDIAGTAVALMPLQDRERPTGA
jgi:hypothetical protein